MRFFHYTQVVDLLRPATYTKLLNEKDSEESETSTAANLEKSGPPAILTAIFTILCFLLLAILFLIVALLRRPTDNECARQLSIYSPTLDAVEYGEITLQNTFEQPSMYRGPPTQKLEEAWHSLYRFGVFNYPESAFENLFGSSAKDENITYERMPESAGGGYRFVPDFVHQLHCLNTIRQYTWYQSGNYGPESLNKLPVPYSLRSSDVGNRMHADHCIETIRKVLMCHADITPLFDIVDPENPVGRVGNFNLKMKCRNYEQLQDWLRENMKLPFQEVVDGTP